MRREADLVALVRDRLGLDVVCVPYSRRIGALVETLVRTIETEHVMEAVALAPCRPDTRWWRRLAVDTNALVCFVHGRVRFGDAKCGAPFPSALVYIGPRPGAFAGAVQDIGYVWRRLSSPGTH